MKEKLSFQFQLFVTRFNENAKNSGKINNSRIIFFPSPIPIPFQNASGCGCNNIQAKNWILNHCFEAY